MAGLLHQIAIYFDTSFNRKILRAADLVKPEVMEIARSQELYDESEQYLLIPRTGAGITSHFAKIPEEKTPYDHLVRNESNPAHDIRVARHFQALLQLKHFSLVIKYPGVSAKPLKIFPKMPQYVWETEAQRFCGGKIIVRHDLLGHCPSPSMSIRRPTIAIEVINTHYPEERAFAAMLNESREKPTVILFDLVQGGYSFVSVDPKQMEIEVRPWAYYIWNGLVYKGAEVTEISTPSELKLELEALVRAFDRKKAKRRAGKLSLQIS
jgi:hypothetical protein